MAASPAHNPLDIEDLVESKVEQFINMRRSQMTEKEMRLAKSLINDPPAGKDSKEEAENRAKDIFRIHRKEDDYFEKLSDLEQVRLYTTLQDHNNRLMESISILKKELLTLLQKREGVDKLDMRELQNDNRILRQELKDLTFKTDKEANMNMAIPSKKKNLLKAFKPEKPTTTSGRSTANVVYTDKKAIQTKIDELKSQYQTIEAQIKACHDTMNKLGIKPGSGETQPTNKTGYPEFSSGKSPQELKQIVVHMESNLEALVRERESMEAKNRATEAAIQSKMLQLNNSITDNTILENKFIALKTRDPFEIKREIQTIKGREIELTNRINSLKSLPMYKNDGAANTLVKLREAEDQILDLTSQVDVEARKLKTHQDEVDKLKGLIDVLQNDRQSLRRDITRIRAMYEAGVARQKNNLVKGISPIYNIAQQPAETAVKGDPTLADIYNEKLIRTLGLVRWKGEEPAWFKLQFLDRARKINPNDKEAIKEEYTRLSICKMDISMKLEKIQALLKATVDEEKKHEDEHLLNKKRKENELMKAQEQRKDLEATLDKIGTNTGKVFVGKNIRTGEEVYYNDAVSVFSLDKSDLFKITYEENLLDLYIDRVDIDSTSTRVALSAAGVEEADPSTMISVLAVNFFNHPTLTSHKCIGCQPMVAMQCTFSIKPDGFFIEYCRTNSLDIDLYYSNEKGHQIKFAEAKIDMKDLLDANLKDKRPDYIGVVNKHSRVYSLANQHLGILTFRMKPRLPIYTELYNYNLLHGEIEDVPKNAFDLKYLDKPRKLSVKICNGYSFSTMAKVYIVYRLQTFPEITTAAVPGSNPKFDDQRTFEIVYTKGFRDGLKNNMFEIMAFDDSIPFKQSVAHYDAMGIRLQDVVGTGLVSLVPLTYDKPIVEKVYLKDTGGKVRGSIFVKIYWDDLPVPDKDFTEFTRAWEDELSRRIMGEIKRNKLTLQGAFNLADADNSQDITRDEFSSVLTKVLQIQITPREMNEYWSRVIRGTNKDTVSYSHLLTFYGNLLDASVLGHGGSMKKGIADIKRMFEDGDKGLPGSSSNQSIADQAKIFEQYSLELKRVMKEKNMNEKQLFDTFDSDKNHRINRHEFHICNEDILKVKTSPRDLDLIFDYADKNKTDNVDLAELLKMINFDVKGFIQDKMSTPRSLDPNHMDNWKSDRILHEFLQLVKEYMANNNMSVYQFFAMVDKSKDSYLTKAEMQNFFENVMNLKIPALHMKVILNEIDKSGDNKVSVKEFIAFMHLEESFSLLNDEGKRAELKDLLVAKIFYEYQVKNELTPADLVLKMDADGNGNIDYFELGHFCRNLANNIPSRDIEKFMAFVDQDLSKNISLKELERVLEAYNKIAEEEVDLTPAELEDLLKRILPLIDQNKERLKMMLESHEDKPGEMKLDVFRKSMNKTTLFTPKDVDLIINPLLRQFISYRRIRYTALFDLKKNYSQYAKMKESGLGTYRGSKLVEQIFAAMKKVGIKHKITHYELFQCFDTDDSGFLTLKEMKRDLHDMKIDLTEEQFSDMMKTLDRNGDGKISFIEFDTYLKNVNIKNT